MSLLEKMLNAGSIKGVPLADSILFNEKDITQTSIPIINLAFSGDLLGGISSGLTLICGPSKHFKSNLGLVCVKAYMKKHPDAVCLFYDSEFGITNAYIKANGIDSSRVIHIPIENLEQMKFDVAKRLDEIERGEKVIIFVDSLGNLASKKEAEDALNEKSAQDMTRAKVIKSIFRIITPHLTIKDIPCIVINHIYMDMGLFPKAIVSGGSGPYLSSDNIFIIGRSQDKDSEGTINGYNFTINIEKSRYVKEKSKFEFEVNYEKGIYKFSGLLDLAVESGHLLKPKKGFYQIPGEEKMCRESALTKDFYIPLLKNQEFQNFVKEKYQLASYDMMQDDDEEDEG